MRKVSRQIIEINREMINERNTERHRKRETKTERQRKIFFKINICNVTLF